MSAAGWRIAAVLATDDRNRLSALAGILAAEFRAYDFGTYETRDGIAIAARRRADCPGPGVCVVITADYAEMRRALLGQGSPPDPSG